MKRRSVIQSLGGFGLLATGAGCIEGISEGGGPRSSPKNSTEESSPTEIMESTPTERPCPSPTVSAEDDFDRIDEPPCEVPEPNCPSSDHDPLYLCANVPADPSLPFQQERGAVLRDEGLRSSDREQGYDVFYAALLTSAGDLDRIYDNESTALTLVEETDFETHAVLVVQTGWGSSSNWPHLRRIESTEDGIHAFGCQNAPCVVTDDVAVRTAVARFERPESLDSTVVSLTLTRDTRVTFAAREGVVDVDL